MDDALQQRREQEHREHLADLQEDVAKDHDRLRFQGQNTLPEGTRPWQTQSGRPARIGEIFKHGSSRP
jgi:hypothetical protein